MRNKILTITLIITVIIIWGWVVYIIINKKVEISHKENMQKKTEKNNQIEKHDSLILSYRDPFLGGQGSQIIKKQVYIRKKTNPIKVNIWADIKFLGVISSTDGKNKIGIILFNGVEKMIKEGSSIENYRFIKYYNDSTTVTLYKEMKTIKKQRNEVYKN